MNYIIMSNKLEIITTSDVLGKTVNVYGTFDEPLFLAKDVAEWIDHSNVTEMLKYVDDDEKLTSVMFRAGQNREVNLLTENGLYEVLMQSRKPIAKQFKSEVKKILKSVRKNGGYIANQEQMTPEQIVANALVVAQNIIENQKKELEQAKPKVEFYDTVTGSSDTIDMRTVATVLNCGLGRNKIFEILRDKKILDRKNIPYQQYIDKGYFRTIESTYSKPDGTTCINIKTVIFQKGLDFIRKVLTK